VSSKECRHIGRYVTTYEERLVYTKKLWLKMWRCAHLHNFCISELKEISSSVCTKAYSITLGDEYELKE